MKIISTRPACLRRFMMIMVVLAQSISFALATNSETAHARNHDAVVNSLNESLSLSGFLAHPSPITVKIDGSNCICPGSTVQYTVNSGYSDYQWSIIGGNATLSFSGNTATVVANVCCDKTFTLCVSMQDQYYKTFAATFVVKIEDKLAPTVDPLPALTISCEDVIPAADTSIVNAWDNCNNILVSFIGDECIKNDPCDKLIKRTYKVEDLCENSVLVCQLIHVVDTTAPVVEPLVELTFSCEQTIPAPDVKCVVAIDNCCTPYVKFIGEECSGDLCDKLIKRSFKVKDHCGNEVIVCQLIHVVDTTAPVVDSLPEWTISCEDTIPVPDISIVHFTDNCCTGYAKFISDEFSGEGCERLLTRTYKVKDHCGNYTLAYQLIHIIDTIAPVIDPLEAIVLFCNDEIPEPSTGIIQTRDNCTGTLVVTHVGDVRTGGDCNIAVNRTYKVVDACGNEAFASQSITLVDTTAPTVDPLPALTISCEDVIPAADTSIVNAWDNCNNILVSFIGDECIKNDPCDKLIKRTYKVEDLCENSVLVCQLIHVVDTTAPVVEPLVELTFSCEQTIPAPDVKCVVAIDNCCTPYVKFIGEECSGDLCDKLIKRSFKVKDHCGNEVIVCQLIHVVDTTAPVVDSLPEWTISCEDTIPVPDISIVHFTDNCCTGYAKFISDEFSGEGCERLLTRTYKVKDHCGNYTLAYQLIHIIDTIAPVIDPLEAIVLFCNDEIPEPSTGIIQTRDNCTGTLVVTHVGDVRTGGDCNIAVNRTYKVVDACGNEAFASQSITLVDTTAPTVDPLPALTISCEDVIPAADTSIVNAWDNCNNILVSFIGDECIKNDPCDKLIKRTYKVEDLCENSVLVCQLIHVVDTTAPVVEPLVELTFSCEQTIPAPDVKCVVAIDNCCTPYVKFIGEECSGDLCDKLIKRSFKVKDHCGNEVIVCQLIHVVDTTAPVVDSLPEWTISCEDTIPVPDISIVHFTDNCCTGYAKFISDEFSGEGCERLLTRTYKVKDHCGNYTLAYQLIHIIDTIAPVIDPLEAIVLFCNDEIPEPSTGIIQTRDNCTGTLVVTHVGDVRTGGDCNIAVNRTYKVVDACGNEAFASQSITLVDTTAPTVDPLPALTISCEDVIPAADTSIVNAWDNCNNILVSFIGDECIKNDPCDKLIKRTYKVEDLCENSVLVCQLIHVVDTTAPVVEPLVELTFSCEQTIPAPDVKCVVAIDNCCTPYVKFIGEECSGDLCDKLIKRSFKVKDHCGNEVIVCQLIHVVDTTAPVVDSLPEWTISCEDTIPVPDISIVHFTDNCCTGYAKFISDEFSGEGCERLLTRTYKVKDHCGNYTLAYQLIHIIDTIAPVIDPLEAIVLFCNDEIPEPSTGIIQTRDNCTGTLVVTHVGDVRTGGDCNIAVNRTYKVVDACGNEAFASQSITLVDTTAPTVDPLPALTISCEDVIPAADTSIVNAWDNCNNILVSFIGDECIKNDPCDKLIKRTYKVEDLCENSVLVCQLIHVVDTTAPVVEPLVELTFSCEQTIPAPDVKCVVAIDNCCTPYVKFIGEECSGDLCDKLIKRSFKVKDHCGNEVIVCQLIHVVDTTAPVVDSLPEWTISCEDTIPVPDISIVHFTDNCCTGYAKFISDEFSGEGCERLLTRTYKVKDHCGNYTLAYQLIHIIDTIAPVIDPLEAIVLFCNDEIPEPSTGIIQTRDNCTGTLVVTHVGDVRTGGDCNIAVNRTYKVVDACGNEAFASQSITLVDTTAPTVDPLPALTISCEDVIPAADTSIVNAWDNCNNILVSFIGDECIKNDPCDKLIKRTYKVEDLCENSVLVCQLIHVVDTTAPVVEPLVELTFSCEQTIPAPDVKCVVAIDNCCTPYVKFIGEECSGDLCDKLIKRSFKVKDHCGNEVIVCQLIHVVDTTAPVVDSLPEWTISCEDTIPAPDISIVHFTDNCCTGYAKFISDEFSGEGCERLLTRTYKVKDHCGNYTLAYQLIHIIDTIAPTAGELPEWTLSCEDSIFAPDVNIVIAEDNCSEPIVTYVSDVTEGEDCLHSIIRTYKVEDACGNSILVNQTIHIIDTIAPEVDPLEALNLFCGDTIPEPFTGMVSARDNCTGTLLIEFIGELRTGLDCNLLITRNYRVADACGNATFVEHLISRIDTIAPTAELLPDLTLSCEDTIPAPDVNLVVAEDNCGGNVTVTFVEDVPQGEGCQRSVIRTYNVEDACGNSILVTQLINIVDTIAPTLTNLPPAIIDLGCDISLPLFDLPIAEDVCDNEPIVNIWRSDSLTLEDPYTLSTTTIFIQAVDACGNMSEIYEVVVNLHEAVSCNIEAPATQPLSGSTGNTLTVTVSDVALVASYNWSIDATALANGYSITDGQDLASVTYTAGTGAATFMVVIVDTFGCSDTCFIEVMPSSIDQFCTLTQGFYGNANGNFCDGRSGEELMDDLMAEGAIVVGSGGNTFTIDSGDAQCIIEKLPGGGTPSSISEAINCATTPDGMLKNGRLDNILLSQTITLRLNMRLSPTLGNFQIINGVFYTWESTGCGGDDGEATGSVITNTLPASVVALLPANPTVQDISNLANQALGGLLSPSVLGDVNETVSMINEGFDECKWGSNDPEFAHRLDVGVNQTAKNELVISTTAYPNPFVNSSNIEIKVSKNVTTASVDVYTLTGIKVANLYKGALVADQAYTFQLDLSNDSPASTFVVVTRTEKGTKSIQILRLR